MPEVEDPIAVFETEKRQRIASYSGEREWRVVSAKWAEHAFAKQYMYNFTWLGRPIIQLPMDMVAVSELIWAVKPDLIVETGIAHGGSLILSASMLALLDICEAEAEGRPLDPGDLKRQVLGVDIDIRSHNRTAIERHPLSRRITMIQGSSVAPEIVERVLAFAQNFKRVMICLDSNHTEDHVLAELEAYAPLTSKGSYCVVFDTIIEDLPPDMFPNRPWGIGNNSKTAVREYLRRLADEGRTGVDGAPLALEADRSIEDKLLISAAPGGFLRRT